MYVMNMMTCLSLEPDVNSCRRWWASSAQAESGAAQLPILALAQHSGPGASLLPEQARAARLGPAAALLPERAQARLSGPAAALLPK